MYSTYRSDTEKKKKKSSRRRRLINNLLNNNNNNNKRSKDKIQSHEVNVEYNSDRDHEEILDKIADGQMSLPFKEQGDVVKAQLLCLQGGYDVVKVKVRLTIEPYKPTPKVFRLTRQNNTGTTTLCEGLYSLLKGCDLDSIEELVLGEGVVRILGDIRERFKNVVSIDLSNAQLTELPVEITQFFPRLEVLKLNENKLIDLPSLVNLKSLRELHCDNNQLTKIRTDLRENKMLRVISLKGNKLTKPVMDMKALSKVHTFHLYGNPVEYLPEMHHCKSLRCLSLVNVVVSANDDLTDVDVQIGDTTSSYIPQAISGKLRRKAKRFRLFLLSCSDTRVVNICLSPPLWRRLRKKIPRTVSKLAPRKALCSKCSRCS